MGNTNSYRSECIVYAVVYKYLQDENLVQCEITVDMVQSLIADMQGDTGIDGKNLLHDVTVERSIQRLIDEGVFISHASTGMGWIISINPAAGSSSCDHPISQSTRTREEQKLVKSELVTAEGLLNYHLLLELAPWFRLTLQRVVSALLRLPIVYWPDGERTSLRIYVTALRSLKQAGINWDKLSDADRMLNLQIFRDHNRSDGISISDSEMLGYVEYLLCTRKVKAVEWRLPLHLW